MHELVVVDPAPGDAVGRRRPLSPIVTVAVAMAVVLQLASPPAHADSARVRLQDGRFDPERIDVSVGDTVVWKAKDDRHTVTARNGEFDSSSSGLMYDGDEFRWVFTRPGVYPYFCRVQPMQGEVVVVGNAPDQGPASSPTATSTPPAAPAAPEPVATAPSPTVTTPALPSTTTTMRRLLTSSTVNWATTTSGPVTEPVSPHEPPAVDADVVRGAPPEPTETPPEASVAGTPAALHHQRETNPTSPSRVALLIGLPAAAVGTLAVSRRRRRRPPRRPSG